MRSNETATLITTTYEPGDFSDEGKVVETRREVYINSYSISLNAKLSAANEKLDLVGRFEMWTFEYAGEKLVEVDGNKHKVLSADRRGDRTIISYGDYLK